VKLLALETATQHLSVALWCDGVCLERAAEVAHGGSERLLPWVSELLAEAGMALTALDGIAFGAGPGGFTGLRLACGVAQGLACGLDLPVVGISSLEALAWVGWQQEPQYSRIFACLDARMDEVYCAAYEIRDEFPVAVLEPFVAAPATVDDMVRPQLAAAGWLGCGDGFAVYPELLAGQLAQLARHSRPTAAAVARLAAVRFAKGEGSAAALAAPIYVRDKVALTTAERLARGGVK
jgi:tRNA threonylcarbamoyladenosine biosynthesis protein TsaB